MDSLPFYVSDDDPPSKRKLMQSALELFVRDGIPETSVRALAEASGYTNPVLFKYFAGKDDLALRLFEACYVHLAGRLDAALSPERPFAENLRALLEAYALLVDEEIEAFLFVQENLRRFWPRVSPSVRARSHLTRLHRLVREGIDEGAVAPDPDAALLVAAIGGILAQVARLRYFGEVRPTGELVPALERLLSRMLGAG